MYLPHKHQIFMLFVKVTAPLISAVSGCFGVFFSSSSFFFFFLGGGGLFCFVFCSCCWGGGGGGPE